MGEISLAADRRRPNARWPKLWFVRAGVVNRFCRSVLTTAGVSPDDLVSQEGRIDEAAAVARTALARHPAWLPPVRPLAGVHRDRGVVDRLRNRRQRCDVQRCRCAVAPTVAGATSRRTAGCRHARRARPPGHRRVLSGLHRHSRPDPDVRGPAGATRSGGQASAPPQVRRPRCGCSIWSARTSSTSCRSARPSVARSLPRTRASPDVMRSRSSATTCGSNTTAAIRPSSDGASASAASPSR